MSESLRDHLIQAARAWISHTTGLALAQIWDVDNNLPRPTGVYVTVDIPTFDASRGVDELVPGIDEDDNPTWAERGARFDVLTVNAFGRNSEEILTVASRRLRRPSTIELLNTHGVSIFPLTPAIPVTVTLANEREKRFAKDFRLQYSLVDADPQVMIEPILVELDTTFQEKFLEDEDLDALVETISITF